MYTALMTTQGVLSKHGELFQSGFDALTKELRNLGFNTLLITPYLQTQVLQVLDFDLLVLQGGESLGDIHDRDQFELKALTIAIERQIAVLAICRGMQLVNVFFGGTLRKIDGHVGVIHSVSGTFEGLTNSFHEWAIDSVGRDLTVEAVSNDGAVEALSNNNFSIMGIMWHPERDGCSIPLSVVLRKIGFEI